MASEWLSEDFCLFGSRLFAAFPPAWGFWPVFRSSPWASHRPWLARGWQRRAFPLFSEAPRPSLWSQSSSCIDAHRSVQATFQGLPGASVWGCPQAGSPLPRHPGRFHAQALKAEDSGSRCPCRVLQQCSLATSRLPSSRSVPAGLKAQALSSRAVSFPSLPVRPFSGPPLLQGPPPRPHLKMRFLLQLLALGSSAPCWLTSSHHTDEPALSITLILSLPCSQAFRALCVHLQQLDTSAFVGRPSEAKRFSD